MKKQKEAQIDKSQKENPRISENLRSHLGKKHVIWLALGLAKEDFREM